MKKENSKYISESQFVVIDVETTGLSPYAGRITEIGMIKMIDGKIIDEYSTLLNPEQFISPYITRLTGITNEMVYKAPKFRDVKNKIYNFLGDSVFVGHNVGFDFSFVEQSFLRESNVRIGNPRLCTSKLARRLIPILKSKSLGSLIQHFNIPVENRHRALDDAKATALILNNFIDILENKFDIETLDDLLTFQNKQVYQIKKPPKNFIALKDTLHNLPDLPGVYFFYDKYDDLIYIGKAKNLKDRVNSYFYHNTSHSKKVFEMVRDVRSIKFETTGTELSALLMEAKLIRKNKPFYNSAQKRYRKYPFLKINMSLEYPFLDWNYDIKEDGSEYYGPFISRYHVESFIDSLNRIFMIRECRNKEMIEDGRCIYPDIKRCSAPCRNKDKEKYWAELSKIIEFLQGKNNELLNKFEDVMNERAANGRFEEAAELRDRIKMIRFFIERHKHLPPSIHMSNYIVVVPSIRTSFEMFLIKKGRVAVSEVFLKFEERKIRNLLESYYSEDTLFEFDKTVFEPSFMQILIGWIYKNYDDIIIINISGKKEIDEILLEIKRFLGGKP